MPASEPPDSHFRPTPAQPAGSVAPPGSQPLPVPAAPGPAGGGERGSARLDWKTALIGVGLAIGFVFVGGIVLAILVVLGSGDDLGEGHGFVFGATVMQDASLVLAAVVAARMTLAAVTPATFGLRRFERSAFAWVAAAFVAYLAFSLAYVAILQPDQKQTIEQDLGIALTAVVAIGIAPFAEEFFFRGFIYQALRDSWGVGLGAISSGVLFGAVHVGATPVVLLPLLAVLGVVLALLFQKTNSLWPPIMLHTIWNTLAVLSI